MALGATALCIGALLVIILRFPYVVTDRSQKALVAGFYQSAPANASLIYWGRYENPRNQRQFSAEYYTKGTVLYTNDIGHLARMTEEKSPLFLAVKHSRVKEIPGPVLSRFKWRKTLGDFELFSTK